MRPGCDRCLIWTPFMYMRSTLYASCQYLAIAVLLGIVNQPHRHATFHRRDHRIRVPWVSGAEHQHVDSRWLGVIPGRPRGSRSPVPAGDSTTHPTGRWDICAPADW